MKTFNLNSGDDFTQKILLDEFKSYFESSREGCNVEKYRLVKVLSTGEIVDLVDDHISIDED